MAKFDSRYRKHIDNLVKSPDSKHYVLNCYVTGYTLKAIDEQIAISRVSKSEWVRDAIEHKLMECKPFVEFLKLMGDRYDKRKDIERKVKEAQKEVEDFMETEGYNNIRRLEY